MFRHRYFPAATAAQWRDWRWQLQHRIRALPELERVFGLSPDERLALQAHKGNLPLAITPYYAALMARDNPQDPLRRTHIPVSAEGQFSPGEYDDPLGEDGKMVAPGLVQRYPDRVLFLVTNVCASYCRYCTRSRLVADAEQSVNMADWRQALAYIRGNPAIRDVLISGGDPLLLSDDKLGWLLGELRAIPHVEFIRLGTKIPLVLPQRVTPALTRMLKRFHPLWMSLHIIHPHEFTPESAVALNRLADAGIPLGGQMVLLRGINDEADTMRRLVHLQLRHRVRPYYLLQLDPIRGSAHFRTPISKGLELIDALRGHTSGYAVPAFIIDSPGGGGKVQLVPDHVVGRQGDDLIIRNFAGQQYRYHDPAGTYGSDRPLSDAQIDVA